ncbi:MULTISPECIES: outer membrane protein assembly factor BamE [unclassified Pusillimonas]|uniref:outer membrane protein assembly factor BamE n=1 Tax=unclassified Pusillimonas TaxID=2640016 RepID=UPI000B8E42D4|nr:MULTISPECIES: outer membrane protein assembly factor BamE [unclassified Pusillimonas]OXR49594.1 hypothetical protein PuT2_07345 [Pusillimonas sp. T2]ROT44380.1 outer membrane protein assembly factor BamE [Pusillimonas sp. NJUB218]
MLKKLFLSILVMLSLSACETIQSAGTDKYSPAALKENLKVGVTTPDEVRRIYGEPDMRSDDPDGPRHWMYSVDDTKNALIDSAISFIPVYGASTAKNAVTESRQLFVYFKQNRVSDYALNASKR